MITHPDPLHRRIAVGRGDEPADLVLRVGLEYWTAENVPADLRLGLALARIDDHGVAAALRPFLYFGLIALIFGLKRRYRRR